MQNVDSKTLKFKNRELPEPFLTWNQVARLLSCLSDIIKELLRFQNSNAVLIIQENTLHVTAYITKDGASGKF